MAKESDNQWYYATLNKDGTRNVQAVEILNWEGSAAIAITTGKGTGDRALGVGQPTSVLVSRLFRGKDNVVLR